MALGLTDTATPKTEAWQILLTNARKIQVEPLYEAFASPLSFMVCVAWRGAKLPLASENRGMYLATCFTAKDGLEPRLSQLSGC